MGLPERGSGRSVEPGTWVADGSGRVALALNLIPFAGIAFLWFIGVLRDRLGSEEDRFFATVFLGSGLLFLAALFVAATIVGALLLIAPSAEVTGDGRRFDVPLRGGRVYPDQCLCDQDGWRVHDLDVHGRDLYRGRPSMDGRDRLCAGRACVSRQLLVSWSIMVLPIWVLLISVHILIDNLRGRESRLDEP